MIGSLLPIVLAFALGCGHEIISGDSDAGSGGDEVSDLGSATIDGTVSGNSLVPASALTGTSSPYVFVHTMLSTQFTLVTITDFADFCGNENVMGTMLYISLFENPTVAVSVVTAPGTFDVWAPSLDGQGVPTGKAAVVNFSTNSDQGGQIATAASGTVTITQVSSTRIVGTFDATILGDHLTGTFDAPSCQVWNRSSSIP